MGLASDAWPVVKTNSRIVVGPTTTWNTFVELNEPVAPDDTMIFSVVHIDHTPAKANERIGRGSVPAGMLESGDEVNPMLSNCSEHSCRNRTPPDPLVGFRGCMINMND